MPSPEAILAGLSALANDWRTLAIGWHMALGLFVMALLAGWRPSNRRTGYLLAAPFLSVGALAWASGNPFNGAAFVLLAAWLTIVAGRLSAAPVEVAPAALLVPGALLVAFGWTYPHFLRADHWTAYTYAAPFALVPCPTLAAVIGFTLILGRLRSTRWSAALVAAGLLYGAIGVFRLGVGLDVGLLAGATVLAGTDATAARMTAAPDGVPARAVDAPVRTVDAVDLDRYLGEWFEIARFPAWFQRGCAGDVRATYARRADQRIDVINRCRASDGAVKEARGVARIVDARTRAKLKVRFAPALLSFLPFVWGDYWILGLAGDYSWAVVGSPDRNYLWILARTTALDDEAYAAAIRTARDNGFDTSRLVKTAQSERGTR